MPLSSSSSSLEESFVYLENNRISRPQLMGDKELAALDRVYSKELYLGTTNVTTFGLTKFIEELKTGYRSIPQCTLHVSPFRCNITAIVYSFKGQFNPSSNEYEIHTKERSVYLLITRGPPKAFDPIEVRIRTVSHFD